jgi:hypothetical protein
MREIFCVLFGHKWEGRKRKKKHLTIHDHVCRRCHASKSSRG